MMNLSIVIPTINSGKIIEEYVKRIDKFLSNSPIINEYEIIIAAQTSDDNTFEVIKDIKLKNIRPLFIKGRGKGLGLTIGMKKARYEWVLMTDDDEPYNLSDFLKNSKNYINNYDIIIGSRYIQRGKQDVPLKRKIVSVGYRLLVKTLFRLPQKDIQAGIKLIRKDVFDRIGYPLEERYIWDTELLYKANKKKLKIVEVPVFLRQTGNKLRVSKDLPKMFKDMIMLYFRTR